MANILKMITSNDIVKILLVLLVIYVIIMYVNKKESLENTEVKEVKDVKDIKRENVVIQPDLTLAGPELAPVNYMQQNQINKVVAGSDKLSADELLPKYDDANAFVKQNPVSKLLKEQNFLISGYHTGINTVMQSNKISYQDIRSLPPIPKENVGPWNQSSYEQSPAQMRRFLEIGN
jgi:hypothetical protein